MPIIRYWAHDPIGNDEGVLTEFDSATLRGAEDNGIVFIAEDDSGRRSIVKAEDVVQPSTANESASVTIVAPRYVDERMEAVVAVFDALADAPAPAVMALSDRDDAAETERPTFAEALAALKRVVLGEGGDAQ